VVEARPAILFEFESRYHADRHERSTIFLTLAEVRDLLSESKLRGDETVQSDDVRDGRFEGRLGLFAVLAVKCGRRHDFQLYKNSLQRALYTCAEISKPYKGSIILLNAAERYIPN